MALRFALAALLVAVPVAAPLAGPVSRQVGEAEVKAAYLFNFTRFVEWPEGAIPGSDAFRLCVLADSRMTALVQQTMTGEAVNGRASETAVPVSVDEARRCQMLFVGRTEIGRARPMLDAIRNLPVLTVSDAPRFADTGGMIQFVRVDEHVRFRVNVEAAKRSRITISSRLLRVAADIVGSPK